MSAAIPPVKGVRDFYPEELRMRSWLFEVWRSWSKRFGFEEYDACLLEHEALYLRKAGEEIAEQIYGFEDKGGRRLALRPEMTPSLARLVVQRQAALSFPLKWFSLAQCFRYERMTRGRRREHYQWNVDIVGESSLAAEAELLALLLSVLSEMGLDKHQVQVHLNHRLLLTGLLRLLKVPPARHQAVLVAVDKGDKLPPEELAALLRMQGLTDTQLQQLLGLLDSKDAKPWQQMLLNSKEAQALTELDWLMTSLGNMGFEGWCRFNPAVVRGLAYYTGVVFELRDVKASLRAICGGGRYDDLLAAVGGESMPAVGFGFGDVVMLDLLQEQQQLPSLTPELYCMVIPFSVAEHGVCLSISQQLRQSGFSVYAELSGRKLPKALQLAAALGAKYAVLLMPDELAQGKLIVKQLSQRTEKKVEIASLLDHPPFT